MGICLAEINRSHRGKLLDQNGGLLVWWRRESNKGGRNRSGFNSDVNRNWKESQRRSCPNLEVPPISGLCRPPPRQLRVFLHLHLLELGWLGAHFFSFCFFSMVFDFLDLLRFFFQTFSDCHSDRHFPLSPIRIQRSTRNEGRKRGVVESHVVGKLVPFLCFCL